MPHHELTRTQVLRFRFRRHQLTSSASSLGAEAIDLLDYGVQDTGPDGAAWALAIRGATANVVDDLALTWTLRAAPHAYRRRDIAQVAVATAPFSEVDARKRIFDASKPLLAAGIDATEALRLMAGQMRQIVRRPTPKGEVSRRLTELVDDPYLRRCRPCDATHVYENTFRLAALQGGLELELGSSPPVLRRIPRVRPSLYSKSGDQASDRFHAIRNYLRFYGPARMTDVAGFLDAPVKVVAAHWPDDVSEVNVAEDHAARGRHARFTLTRDLDEITTIGAEAAPGVRLLGPYDPYLQLRDRALLVADAARRKSLWPTLGRPGAVVSDGEILATWRPRTSGRKLRIALEPWSRLATASLSLVEAEAERLAAHRGVDFGGLIQEQR